MEGVFEPRTDGSTGSTAVAGVASDPLLLLNEGKALIAGSCRVTVVARSHWIRRSARLRLPCPLGPGSRRRCPHIPPRLAMPVSPEDISAGTP